MMIRYKKNIFERVKNFHADLAWNHPEDDEEKEEEEDEEEDENARKVVEEEITLPLSQWLSATECDDPSPRS